MGSEMCIRDSRYYHRGPFYKTLNILREVIHFENAFRLLTIRALIERRRREIQCPPPRRNRRVTTLLHPLLLLVIITRILHLIEDETPRNHHHPTRRRRGKIVSCSRTKEPHSARGKTWKGKEQTREMRFAKRK